MKALLAACLALMPGTAEAACRLALILALDVSGSVDQTEYALQLDGIATALEDADVRNALLALPDSPVTLSIFEWSSAGYQRQVLDWTPLHTPFDIDAVAAHLRTWRRATAPEATGLGAAMRYAAGAFAAGPPCWRRVLDISGDGKNNDWPIPTEVRKKGTMADITVNALIIGQPPTIGDERQVEVTELTQYFRAQVLHGPGAFLEVALGYRDYGNAMKRKLLREVSSPPLGSMDRIGPMRRAGIGTMSPISPALAADRSFLDLNRE